MRPETWLPTWTVTMAESSPEAVTLATTRPFSTLAVSNWSFCFPSPGLRSQKARAAITRTTASAMKTRRLVMGAGY